MRALLMALSAIILLAYPLAVYFGIHHFGMQAVVVFLALVFLYRLLANKKAKLKELKQITLITSVIGIILMFLSAIFKQYDWLTYYPVVVSLCLFSVFFISLYQSQSIIERLARIQEPELPESAISYVRKVTQIWCVFFIINASIALYTCFQPLEVWTLYNGLISYLAIGLLFFMEWLVRQMVRKG